MEELIIVKEGGIWEISLNRPKANAIDLASSRKMGEVFMAFRDDPCVLKVINSSVLAGI